MEKKLDILGLPPDVRELVGECELTGRRTEFLRNGRPVVALVSYDEWLAMRETLDIANDEALRSQIGRGDDEARRNALMVVEDLVES